MEFRGDHERQAPRAADGDRTPSNDRDLEFDRTRPRRPRRISGECPWIVYERRVDDRPRARLVFECPTMIRTVRNYPANWRDLSDEELLALSERV